MNKSFHSVWNASKQAYVAAAETISAKGKPSSGIKVAATISALFGGLLSLSAHAQTAPPSNSLPTGGLVSAGQASISANGAHMVINQSSNRAAINWQSFNVGKDAHVQFQQPSAASVTLNRVMSADPSQIFGRISSNGQVILTNPSGVYFGREARVDVGGILATTHGTSDADFMAGKNRYERKGSTGSVINEGELKAALGGYIALLAPEVRNQGAIIAHMGTAVLAAGEAVDLHFDSNNRLTSLRVDPSQIAALVDNRHAVQAPGGLVIISAQSLDRLVGGVVKNSGRIEANGLQQQGGRIMLSASHRVENTGSISANATAGSTAADSGPAGRIEISAPEVLNSGSISASGAGQFSAGKVQVQATNFSQTDSGSIDLSAPSQGGQLSIQTTGKVELQGSVNAQATQDTTSAGTISQGGQIDIAAQGDIEVNNAALDASGGQGGTMALRAKAPSQPDNPNPVPQTPDAPGQGRLAIMGHSTLSTRGRSGYGGSATLLGERIELLDTTALDATGASGGGDIRIGAKALGEGMGTPSLILLSSETRMDAGANESLSSPATGSITLTSSQAVLQGSRLTAPNIQVTTHNLVDSGQWDASAASSGNTQGGRISVNASGTMQQMQRVAWTVDGTATQEAGSVHIEVGTSAWLSGSISAQGLQGGQIAITAPDLVVAGAQLHASGQNGGGRIRVGGGWQGQSSDLANASKTTVMASTLQANAIESGQGGEVVVWSDTLTQFGGDIQARGGHAAGNGGQVEVSSHGLLQYAGKVDVGAPQGQFGRLLLDPKNIEILASANGISTLTLIGDAASRQLGKGQIGEPMNGATSMGTVYMANPSDSTVVDNGGSFHLFNSSTGALITRIGGTTLYDEAGKSVTVLTNGNLVIDSPSYVISKSPNPYSRSAITWMNGSNGQLSNGLADTALTKNNSIWGDRSNGIASVSTLSNGNFVLVMGIGAVAGSYALAWANGSTGKLFDGTLALGGYSYTYLNSSSRAPKVTPLPNGNYVYTTELDQYAHGIVVWCSGSGSLCSTNTNSMKGGIYDNVGSGGITVLSNGNYVVSSPNYSAVSSSDSTVAMGAVTWFDGTIPIPDNTTISWANSLIGNSSDKVGSGGVTALTNGHYVVVSPSFSANLGAVTWANGTQVTQGWVSSSNSLTGSTGGASGDKVGSGGVTALPYGNYVVSSPEWSNTYGAATWLNGTAAISGTTVSSSNSLVGFTSNDRVSSGGVTALSNGNYVVGSPNATNPSNYQTLSGAATWGNGSTGTSGVISASNSLMGSAYGDKVGAIVKAVGNGHYVVVTGNWNGKMGAVTWGNGSTGIGGFGISGSISASNSLVGSTSNDYVGGDGYGTLYNGGVTVLSNGNYVVASPRWTNGSTWFTGAVTWVDGNTGLSGAVSPGNSLVGSTVSDQLGSGGVKALANGTYVVLSPSFNNGAIASAGAATWGLSTGTTGVVTGSNSLIGSSANDLIGSGGAVALSDGRAMVASPMWDQVTPSAITNAGRVDLFKYMNLTTPSSVGFSTNSTGTSQLAAPSLVDFLNAGTHVSLQANNDITLSADILSNPAGINSGSLTLQAGRSVLLNASIALKNAPITITGNEWVSNGVVNAQRDAGNAVITQAASTSLNAGTGAISLTLRGNDSVTKTNQNTGNISLRSVTGASVSVLSQGATANSGLTYESIAVTNNLSLQAKAAIGLSAFSLGGNLSVDSGNGNITQSGALTVAGTTSLAAGTGSITLTNAGNNFTGTVSVASGTGLTLSDANSLSLSAVSANGPISVTAAGDISVNDHIASTATGAALLLKAAGSIVQTAGLNISTNNGNITYWADSDGTGGGRIQIGGSSTLTNFSTGTGDIVMGGGSAGTTAPTGSAQGDVGISLNNTELWGRDITLRGTSTRSGSGGGTGVILGSSTSLKGRNITLEGQGAVNTGASGNNTGVQLQSAWISANGNVAITGNGGGSSSTGGGNHGVFMDNATIDASGTSNNGLGSVTLTGTGGGQVGADTDNDGVRVSGGSWVRAHSGTVTLAGTAGANASSTGLAFAGGTGMVGLITVPNLVGATKNLSGGTLYQQSGAVVLRADSVEFDPFGQTELRTTTALTLEPLGSSFSGTGLNLPGNGLTLGSNLTSLTLGKTGNTGNITLDRDMAVSSVRLLGGNVAFNGGVNSFGTLAASGVGSLNLVNSSALTLGTVSGTQGVSASGPVDIATQSGHLTVSQNITASSLVLNAGSTSNAGTSAGGNLVISGSPTISVTGRATFYTGSVSGSTGLTGLVGAGSGRFRYNSDEISNGYDTTNAALGTGLYAIYREQPTLSVTASNVSAQYANAPVYVVSLSGGANGDTAAQALSGVTFAADGARSSSSNVVVGSHTITAIGGSSLLGYAVNSSYATGTLTVTPKALTVSGTAVASKDYDGTPNASLSGGVLGGIVGVDAVTPVDAGSFNSPHAAPSVNVTASYTLSGSDSSNYSVTQPTGLVATINPKAITATAAIGGTFTRAYNGTTSASGASVTGTVAGAIAGDNLAFVGGGYTLAYNDAHVAHANAINASGTGSFAVSSSTAGSLVSDYALTQPSVAAVVASITPAPLTATLSNTSVTRDYNGNTDAPAGFTPTWTITGLVSGDTAASLLHTGAAYNSKDVLMANKVSVSGVSMGSITGNKGSQPSDYEVASSSDVAATITPKSLMLTGLTASDKVYDGRSDVVTVTNWGAAATGVGSESLSLTHGPANLGAAGAGSQTVTVANYVLVDGTNAELASNYVLPVSTATTSITVNKAPLTVRAKDDAKFITMADVSGYNGVALSGFVNGESAAVVSGSAVITRNNSGVNDARIYPNVLEPNVTGLGASNYSFTPVNGSYTIVPSNQLLVRVSDASTVYGSAASYSVTSAQYFNGSAPVNLSGITADGANSFTVADGVGGTATFSLNPVGVSNSGANKTPVGTWQLGLQGEATLRSGWNFSNAITVVGMHSVAAKPLTASVGTVSKVYDGSTSASSVSLDLSPKETGDTVTAGGVGQFSTRHVGSGLRFDVDGVTLQGADALNYYLLSGTHFTGNTGAITAKPITLTPQAGSRAYNGQTALTASAADLTHLSNQLGVVGDSVSAVTLALNDKNVATGKTLTATAATVSDGNGGNNYSITLGANTTSAITRLNTVTWTGGNSGNWFDPANWAGGAVPDLANVANVVIPSGVNVSFDKSGAQSPVDTSGVVSLDSLGAQGSLTQANGTFNIGSGGMQLASYTQNGGILTNAGTTTLDSWTQSGGSFAGTGSITTGTLTQTGGTLSAGGNLTVTSDFSQGTTGSISVTGITSITDTSGGVQLGNLSSTGSLSVTSTDGAITQATDTAITASGTSSFAASTGSNPVVPANITLTNSGNDFGGALSASGDVVKIFDQNTLSLGNVTTKEDFEIKAGGDVTQDKNPSNKIVVGGDTTIVAQGDVILDVDDNDFKGSFNAKGKNISVKDINDLTLGDIHARGDLDGEAGNDINQDITNGKKILVDGKTRLKAKRKIKLDGKDNKFTKGVTVLASSYSIVGDSRKNAEEAQGKAVAGVQLASLPGTGVFNATPPQVLVMTSGTASGSSSGTAASTSSANSTGVTVDLQNTSQQDTPLMVAVSLPKGASTVGTGFSFEMPESVKGMAGADAEILITQTDGSPLPAWLKFDQLAMRFESTAVPDSALPMQLLVALAGRSVTVVISERTE
jgi:filamentous hemagglutinin family protein